MDELPVSTVSAPNPEPSEFGTKFLEALSQAQSRQAGAQAAPETKEKKEDTKQAEAKPVSSKSSPKTEPTPTETPKESEQKPKSPLDFPDAEDVPKTIKSTKAADDFKRIKSERDELRKQIDDLKASSKSGADDSVKAKLDELTKEKDELSNRLRLLDIERHPEFQRKYTQRIESITGKVKEIVGSDATKLVSLLSLEQTDDVASQIDDIVGGLNPTKQAKLGAYLVEYERAQAERAQEIESAKTEYQKTVERLEATQRQALEQRSLEDQATWDRVSKSASVLEVFEQKEDDQDWNSEVSQRLNTAKAIFSGNNTPEDLAKASLWAAAGPKYRELLYAEMELRKRAESELSKYRKAEPGVTSNAAAEKSGTDKSVGFVERVMSSMSA